MNYKILKLKFKTDVHFGNGNLSDAENIIYADTIFSAICQEYIKLYSDNLEELVDKFRNNLIYISDTMPYIEDIYYVPKPIKRIESDRESNSVLKKAAKKLNYIPINCLGEYLKGDMEIKSEVDHFENHIGKRYSKVSVNLRNGEEAEPFRVGTYRFKESSGLYFIVAYEKKEDFELIFNCMNSIGYSGIGGKKSSGLGKFELCDEELSEEFKKRLKSEDAHTHMLISVALPTETEIHSVIQDANFTLIKRAGFVASQTYGNTQKKKKDLFVMKSGSCCSIVFQGDIYDVGDGEGHPVYRYAKPLFLEVE